MPVTQQRLGEWFDQAVAAENRGDHSRALALYDQIRAHAPAVPQVLLRRGIVLSELGRPHDALAAFDAALACAPDFCEVHFCRGTVLHALKRLADAIGAFDAALRCDPGHERAAYNRCVVLGELERFDDVRSALSAGVARWPANPMFRVGLGEALLRDGDFETGWQVYEGRAPLLQARDNGAPPWRGEELRGKHLWIQAEQGLGDTIQFCRYGLLARDAGATVSLHVQPRLRRLLADNLSGIAVGGLGEDPPASDYQSLLLDLPRRFHTRLENVPVTEAYLRPSPERVAQWRTRLGDAPFRAGICWQGLASYRGKPRPVDIGRSFPVSCLSRLSALAGVELVSLQKGEGAEQLNSLPAGMTVRLPGDDLEATFDDGPDGFLDAAAVMACCDLVITSDTAIAHLAGATGTPTWLALQKHADWRWLTDRTDSPWYPSLRLFRQTNAGAWDTVFDAMTQALADRMRGKSERAE